MESAAAVIDRIGPYCAKPESNDHYKLLRDALMSSIAYISYKSKPYYAKIESNCYYKLLSDAVISSYETNRYLTLAGIVGVAIIAIRIIKNCLFGNQKIVILDRDTNDSKYRRVIKKLSRAKVLGFDCEWVNFYGRKPVALLQLATQDGFCALFRLNMMGLPFELEQILVNRSILKVGVAPIDDGRFLSMDYSTYVQGTLDLRYLAEACGEKSEGLAAMSLKYLNKKLDKTVALSDWQATKLTKRQIQYAADDAFVGVELFQKLTKKLLRQKYYFTSFWSAHEKWNCILSECESFIDTRKY